MSDQEDDKKILDGENSSSENKINLKLMKIINQKV